MPTIPRWGAAVRPRFLLALTLSTLTAVGVAAPLANKARSVPPPQTAAAAGEATRSNDGASAGTKVSDLTLGDGGAARGGIANQKSGKAQSTTPKSARPATTDANGVPTDATAPNTSTVTATSEATSSSSTTQATSTTPTTAGTTTSSRPTTTSTLPATSSTTGGQSQVTEATTTSTSSVAPTSR